MKTRTRWTWLLLLAGMAAGFGSLAAAQCPMHAKAAADPPAATENQAPPAMMNPPAPGGPMGGPMMNRMGLSEDQRKAIEKLRTDGQQARLELRKEMMRLRNTFQGEMLKDSPDLNALRSLEQQMGELRTRMRVQTLEHRFAMRTILTPEQREKAQMAMGRRGEARMQRGMRGMRGPCCMQPGMPGEARMQRGPCGEGCMQRGMERGGKCGEGCMQRGARDEGRMERSRGDEGRKRHDLRPLWGGEKKAAKPGDGKGGEGCPGMKGGAMPCPGMQQHSEFMPGPGAGAPAEPDRAALYEQDLGFPVPASGYAFDPTFDAELDPGFDAEFGWMDAPLAPPAAPDAPPAPGPGCSAPCPGHTAK